jgi:NhaA family Na+:H+ antiporter
MILPLFAFFNTGIVLVGFTLMCFHQLILGIIVGLCIGKPLGIIGFCWLASKFKLATLSNEISWLQLTGAACWLLVLLCQLLLLVLMVKY